MKKAIIGLSAAAIVALIGLWFYGRPAYQRHKEKRSIEQAAKFMAKGDYRDASLSARQTLQVNPRNLEACRILAELSEKSRSPHALDWRRRVAELAPTIENKLMLASTALRAQGPPYTLAAQTLEELADSAKDVAAYHVVSAELALKLNKASEAAAQYQEASRLEPTNELHQLNLAVLRLRSTNAVVAAEARAALERLGAGSNLHAVALRWLVADSLRKNDLSRAESVSKQLLVDSHANLDDWLQPLSILQLEKNPQFDAALEAVKKNSLTNAVEIYGVSGWMISHGQVDNAMGWLTNCPARLRAEQPAPLALVDCYVAKKDWGGLETFLQKEKWADREFLRFAYLSRAAAEQKQELAAESRWRTAVREAGDRIGPLAALLNMAGSWGRNQAREDLLWLIAQRFPRERWALRELDRFYLAAGNTRGLNKLYATMASYDPKDFAAQNNLAATSMLLKLNLAKAHELAKELYAKHPEEAIVTSTYAYSLHLQGRTREGLAGFKKLKAESLENPPVDLYCGILLAGIGETNKANKYLKLAERAQLLPEEKALLTAALNKR